MEIYIDIDIESKILWKASKTMFCVISTALTNILFLCPPYILEKMLNYFIVVAVADKFRYLKKIAPLEENHDLYNKIIYPPPPPPSLPPPPSTSSCNTHISLSFFYPVLPLLQSLYLNLKLFVYFKGTKCKNMKWLVVDLLESLNGNHIVAM